MNSKSLYFSLNKSLEFSINNILFKYVILELDFSLYIILFINLSSENDSKNILSLELNSAKFFE